MQIARVDSTGEEFPVIVWDGSITAGSAIIDAMERAGAFVIGLPQSFRFWWPGNQRGRWVTLALGTVVVLDSNGAYKHTWSEAYFSQYFTLAKSSDAASVSAGVR